MTGKVDRKDQLVLIGLFVIAFFISCNSSINPFGLYRIDDDTSVYMTIARGITEGQVPYRDFFDNKGPLLYLFSVPGMMLGGFTGVWITGLIFLYISVFFAYKTALFFAGRFSAFFGVVFSFVVFRMFYYETAGADYAIPFMMISLYIFTKFYFSKINPSIIELVCLGFCFSTAILIRINMFPLWLGFCLVIIIESIVKRNFLLLLKYILWFSVGIIIVFIPIILYLYMNNAVADYISQNLVAGSSRASGLQNFSVKDTIKNFFIIIGKHYSFTPLIIGFLLLIKKIKTAESFYYIGFILAFSFSVLFLAIIGTNYSHYNMVIVPFFIPAFTFFIEKISGYFSEIKYKKTAILLFLCLVFSGEILTGLFGNTGMIYKLTSRSREEYITLGNIIDENTIDGEELISLGRDRRIYLFTNRRPASRFIYQLSGAVYYPNTIPEFLSDMETRRPAIIVINKDEIPNLPDWYSPVFEMINNEYFLLEESENYYMFRREG